MVRIWKMVQRVREASGVLVPKDVQECRIKTRMYVTSEFGVRGQVRVYNQCACNEFVALKARHHKDLGLGCGRFKQIARETEQFYDTKLQPCTYQHIINNYNGAKKKKYIRAAIRLRNTGFDESDARLKMFIKVERFAKEYIGVKPPRAIQYRDPKFNLMALTYIHPFEQHYYPTLTYGACSDTRVIMKGMNWYQRAEMLIEKSSCFKKPKYYMLDYSAFDSTIQLEHLKATHRKYRKCFGKGVDCFTRYQLYNKGWTRHGLKYWIKGTRMSGDADTGLGNTIISLDCIYGMLRHNNISKYDIMADGDDSIVIVEADVTLDLSPFESYGLSVKAESTTDMFKVEFCQSRLVLTPRPLLVRNPVKVVSNSGVAIVNRGVNTNKWIAAVGECEAAVNPGVPILQAFGLAMRDVSLAKDFDRDIKRRMQGMVVEKRPVTMLARLTLNESWGIPIDMQYYLERMFTAKDISIYRTDSLESRNAQQLSRTWALYKCSPQLGGSSWWSWS